MSYLVFKRRGFTELRCIPLILARRLIQNGIKLLLDYTWHKILEEQLVSKSRFTN